VRPVNNDRVVNVEFGGEFSGVAGNVDDRTPIRNPDDDLVIAVPRTVPETDAELTELADIDERQLIEIVQATSISNISKAILQVRLKQEYQIVSIDKQTNAMLLSPKQASIALGVSTQTLRTWHRTGRIEAQQASSGHRRYVVNERHAHYEQQSFERERIVYARVSSTKQRGDLERQVASLQSTFPTYRVVSDIGSGLNFKRRGLLNLLDLAVEGRLAEVVVSHRDRLARFGFEFIQHVFRRHGALVTVLHPPNAEAGSATGELAEDLLAVVTVFAARHHGRRRSTSGKKMQKDQDISNQSASRLVQSVV
jgi:putative resolvase